MGRKGEKTAPAKESRLSLRKAVTMLWKKKKKGGSVSSAVKKQRREGGGREEGELDRES